MKSERRSKAAGIFRLFSRYQPSYYACMIPLILVNSAIPLTGVWLPKMILDSLAKERVYGEVLGVIGLYIVILLGANTVKNILNCRMQISTARFQARLQLKIAETAMRAEMKEIENAVYKEEILLAANITGLSDVMTILQNLFSAGVTILGLAAMIVRVNLLFFLLAGATLGIKVLLSVVRFRCDADRRREEAKNNRVGGYLDHIQYYNEGAVKEVRVNYARSWLSGKISAFRDRMVELQLQAFHQYRLFEILQTAVFAIQNVCILLILADYYMAGKLSIADFSCYFSAITLLSATLSGVTDQLFAFREKLLYCGDYEKIVNVEEKTDKAKSSAQNSADSDGRKGKAYCEIGETAVKIRFDHVSFSYPGTDAKVLEDVSFELYSGDRAMLVGQNGSGKTTVIKLLCRFYEPDSGKIYVNDTDISRIPRDQYYPLIAAVFQDFSVFSFPIRENVSLKSAEETDFDRLGDCLKKTNLHTVTEGLKEKENTPITRLFSDSGVELSGGERQRLGIARAIYKDAPILMLDEPAASLDVKMEEELYENFYQMTKGKISLTVSHRLSQSSVSNKIFVLDHGIICETGTHEELMQMNGIYAAMFEKQREAYTADSRNLL